MLDSKNCFIFKLKDNIEFQTFDGENDVSSYLLKYNNRYWRVSEFVFEVINAMTDTNSLEDLRVVLEQKKGIQLTDNQFSVIYDFLESSGLLIGTTSEPVKARSPLWFKFTIIPSRIVNKLHHLDFLFSQHIATAVLAICSLWLLYVYIQYDITDITTSVFSLPIEDVLIVYFFTISFALFHELGHATALQHYGLSAGSIGAAVYFIMPVFFTNVTEAWKLKRYQRIIVDIGGIYFQILLLFLVWLLNIYLKSYLLSLSVFLSSFSIVSNLNPFIKMDGYWMLSDYFGTPNVISYIASYWKSVFKIKKTRNIYPVKQRIIIVIYSVFACLFFMYFSVFLLESTVVACQLIYADISNIKLVGFSVIDILNYIRTRFSQYIVIIFAVRIIVKTCIKLLQTTARTKNGVEKND